MCIEITLRKKDIPEQRFLPKKSRLLLRTA